MHSVVVAYGVAWTVLMVYLWTLAGRQGELRRALEELRRQLPPAADTAARATPGSER